MKSVVSLFLIFILSFPSGIFSQTDDKTGSLPELEMELKEMAWKILNGDSTDAKIELNKEFIERLSVILERPDSYEYPFDSIKTISILRPEDNTFRIFTWQIVDQPKDTYYGTLAHYYFGLIQRKYITKSGEPTYLVIPLMERQNLPNGFENMPTTNLDWFGALYYQPKNMDNLITIKSHYYEVVNKTQSELKKTKENGVPTETYTFVPNRYRKRIKKTTSTPIVETHKRIRRKINYYTLLGYNGWDNKSNYKVLEIMHFDLKDSMRVNFGAPILYFSKSLPKMRGLFKYSENAPFSLNANYVKHGMGKKQMIVFDHLGKPNMSQGSEMWERGPEGTYDALYYSKKLKIYRWYQGVELKDNFNKQFTQKKMKKQLKEQKKRTVEKLKNMGIELNPIDKKIPVSPKK